MPTQPYKTKDGKRVPGVTTVIGGNLGWSKGGLMHWAWEQGRDGLDYNAVRAAAADAGTIAHGWAEDDVKGQPLRKIPADTAPEVEEKARRAFESYLTWKRTTKLEVLAAEIALVSEALRFGGCLDGVGTIESLAALVDFKTGKGTYGDHVIQAAAYKALWEEANPDLPLVGGAHIIRFGQEGDFHHHHIPAATLSNGPWTAFQALLTLHGLKKQIEALA